MLDAVVGVEASGAYPAQRLRSWPVVPLRTLLETIAQLPESLRPVGAEVGGIGSIEVSAMEVIQAFS